MEAKTKSGISLTSPLIIICLMAQEMTGLGEGKWEREEVSYRNAPRSNNIIWSIVFPSFLF